MSKMSLSPYLIVGVLSSSSETISSSVVFLLGPGVLLLSDEDVPAWNQSNKGLLQLGKGQ